MKTKHKVKKEDTVGVVGEKLLFQFFDYRGVDIFHLSKEIKKHPFDFIINGHCVEVKTASKKDDERPISFSWERNDTTKLDCIVGILLDTERKKITQLYYFPKSLIQRIKGVGIRTHSKIRYEVTGEFLIKLLK